MLEKYTALLAKLKEATGPFEHSDAEAISGEVYGVPGVYGRPHYMRDLLLAAMRGGLSAVGAALALVEMELPFWTVRTLGQTDNKRWFCGLVHGKATNYTRSVNGDAAPTLPLAILIAWCEAMAQKEASNGNP